MPKLLLERAFKLAREGASMNEIRRALRREGYLNVMEETAGPAAPAIARRRQSA